MQHIKKKKHDRWWEACSYCTYKAGHDSNNVMLITLKYDLEPFKGISLKWGQSMFFLE